MNDLPILAAILTVALQQRPERQNTRNPKGNVYQQIMVDYKEFLSLLTTHHPELNKPKS